MITALTQVSKCSRQFVKITLGDSTKRPTNREDSSVGIILDIMDVPDLPPKFDRDSYEFQVFENELFGPRTQIGLVKAVDQDKDSSALRKLDYNIEQNDFIGIDQVTGKLYAKMSFDAEDTPFGEYISLRIEAKERQDGQYPDQPLLQGQSYSVNLFFFRSRQLFSSRLGYGHHFHSRSERQSTAYNNWQWRVLN